ncbi:hypothetical protein HAX54_003178 [Datura stramonium]|uniref:Uncharacterized protein n=1 Tax=Datura stramonium TaxID=4076 RepID=A0ABS8WUC3_DATST|nr:hypothetical protein [Datura stramonium]
MEKLWVLNSESNRWKRSLPECGVSIDLVPIGVKDLERGAMESLALDYLKRGNTAAVGYAPLQRDHDSSHEEPNPVSRPLHPATELNFLKYVINRPQKLITTSSLEHRSITEK